MQPPEHSPRRDVLARTPTLLPSIALGVLSKFTCAACISVYTGVLSSLGVGFITTDQRFLWVTVLLLVISTVSIAWTAPKRRQWSPTMLAALGAVLVVAGRMENSSTLTYVGSGAVIAAALWNLWLGHRPAPFRARV